MHSYNLKFVFCLSLYIAQSVGNFRTLKFRFDSKLSSDYSLPEKWMKMPVDHFNSSDKRTWRIRYFEDLSHYESEFHRTVFIEIYGEGATPGKFAPLTKMLTTQMNGAMFQIEHRYYGKSIPVPLTDVASYQYLSPEQALADVAAFVKRIKADPRFEGAKVVAIGGSYAGNLAAWTRLVYPDLFHAAVSSSAPVLAKLDFYESLEKITSMLDKYGTPGCSELLKQRLIYYQKLLKTKKVKRL